MKKHGFTLAEILITLGIVGVIAAITLPTLNTSTANAQIGPKLAKAVSAYEEASRALLNEFKADSLADTGLFNDGGNENGIGNTLSRYLKINATNRYPGFNDPSTNPTTVGPDYGEEVFFAAKDGIVYGICNFGGNLGGGAPHLQQRGRLIIDINGNNQPNNIGTDVFVFVWYNDGSLYPVGHNGPNGNVLGQRWQNGCPENQFPSNYNSCAGHIFDNNLRVLYR